MPLKAEFYSYNKQRWINLYEVMPEDQPCSIRDISPSGAQHVYILNCSSDGKPTISTITQLHQEVTEESEELAKGESCKKIIFTGVSLIPNTFRFSHT
jgi:hypothetical protein